MGTLYVQDITPHDIQSFYNALAKTSASNRSKTGKLSGTSQLHYHRCLHAILAYAVRSCIITINPADAVEPPKKDTPEVTIYEMEDCAKLLDALDQLPDLQWRLFFYLALYTACRPGELIALNWSDIVDDTIYIRAGSAYVKGAHGAVRTDKPKTQKSIRKISIPPEVIKLLQKHKIEQNAYRLRFGADWPEPDAVFTGDLGHRFNVSSPTQKFQKIIKEYNLRPITLYGLRHTAASIMIREGIDVRDVANRLGHAQTSTTLNIYVHAFQDANAKATAAIAGALSNARQQAK